MFKKAIAFAIKSTIDSIKSTQAITFILPYSTSIVFAPSDMLTIANISEAAHDIIDIGKIASNANASVPSLGAITEKYTVKPEAITNKTKNIIWKTHFFILNYPKKSFLHLKYASNGLLLAVIGLPTTM